MRAQPGQLVSAAEALAARVRDQEERLEQFAAMARSGLADTILGTAETVGNVSVVAATVEDVSAADLRALAFQVRDRLGAGVGVLGSASGGKGALVVWASDDVVAGGVSAGDIVAAGARVLGGGGSRDASLAQAGGPHGDEIEAAVTEAANAAREALAGR